MTTLEVVAVSVLMGLVGVVALIGGTLKAIATDGMMAAFWTAVTLSGGILLLIAVA